MKQIELTPGIYKIRERNRAYSRDGASKQVFHLLRVSGAGQSCIYYVDGDTKGKHPRRLNFQHDYDVVGRFSSDPEVLGIHIFISFCDDGGHLFEFAMNDAWRLRTIFEEMPWLHKAFRAKTGKAAKK
jgi:hypothetical protein